MEETLRIYLDLCSIQRPLDTQSHVRIALEAEAVLAVIAMCVDGRLELISSDALQYEATRNTISARREHAEAVLALATTFATTGEETAKRAEVFTRQGVKPLDALHLALAEAANADIFCTCDDRFLRKIQQMSDLAVRPLSPLQLIEEVIA